MTELGRGPEFDLIRALRARWGDLASGIGDDAAILGMTRGDALVVSTDAAIEHVHFRRDWLSFPEIGYRATTAALSDLAAMGAEPRGILVALALPRSDVANVLELADGIAEAVRAAGTVIVGGNIARADALSITTTVLGGAFAPLRRSAVSAGDRLYVTGSLGGPRAALRSFSEGKAPVPALRARFAHPSARLAESRWLARHGGVAAIDISDGLAADAAHLAAASNVALEIDSAKVPVFPGAEPADALEGGEEFELLVASRTELATREFSDRFGTALTQVGRALPGAGVQLMRDGRRVAAPPGYDHFSG
jgi:thiamine-monophosphate kinase